MQWDRYLSQLQETAPRHRHTTRYYGFEIDDGIWKRVPIKRLTRNLEGREKKTQWTQWHWWPLRISKAIDRRCGKMQKPQLLAPWFFFFCCLDHWICLQRRFSYCDCRWWGVWYSLVKGGSLSEIIYWWVVNSAVSLPLRNIHADVYEAAVCISTVSDIVMNSRLSLASAWSSGGRCIGERRNIIAWIHTWECSQDSLTLYTCYGLSQVSMLWGLSKSLAFWSLSWRRRVIKPLHVYIRLWPTFTTWVSHFVSH